MGRGKSYALRPDVSHIFQAFGMTTRVARDRLRQIGRDRKTSFRDHANAIEALAQVAYSDTDPEERQSLVYKAFFHTISNAGLQR